MRAIYCCTVATANCISATSSTLRPSQCFLFVGDAMKLWKQLRGVRGIDRVGPILEQDYGLREFVLTDPDGNQLRIGSPLH
jgi:hypothetical protein